MMRRLWWLGLVITAAGLTGTAAPALAAPPPPCAAGYSLMTQQGGGGSITGNGVNQSVTLGAGNCFKAVLLLQSGGNNWYGYQNGYGHCLFANTATGRLDLGQNPCEANHPNEEMLGYGNNNGYWYFEVAAQNTGDWVATFGCRSGSDIEFGGGNGSCDRFSA